MRLLMINDEIITAQTMRDEISWIEYGITDIFLAYNAEEAKETLQREKIDVMLCDIEMPGESGIDLLRWVRQKNMNIECIFLTCHADFSYAQEALKLGCMDYVLMPARYEEISGSVSKVVKRRLEAMDEQQLKEYGKHWLNEQKEDAMEVQGDKRTPKQIVEDGIRYIMGNLGKEDLSVNDVANHCYLNPIYLNRIFKKEKGISINQLIIKERMELAAKLLKNPSIAANTVATKVGFLNYPHFSTTFRKYYGCSPVQFKENDELK